MGPILHITEPYNGEIVHEPVVYIEGSTHSITHMTINGKNVAIHENGNFSNAVVLKEGYNEVVLAAKDRFGREISETLQLMHERSPFVSDKLTQTYAEQKNN